MNTFAWAALGTVAAGAALLLWALYFDRSRGRRRCPKCWYDMAEVQGRLCPECGRTAKHEARLYMTRRRWGWAAAGLAIVGSAWFVNKIPLLSEHGIVVITPTWYMAWRFPEYESPPSIEGRFGSEFKERMSSRKTPEWVRRLLIRRVIATINDPEATPEQLDSALWWILDSEDPNGGSMYRGFPTNQRPGYTDRVAATLIDRQGTIDGIVRGLRHPDPKPRGRAIAAAASLYSSFGALKPDGHGFLPGLPVLLGALSDEDPEERKQIAITIQGLSLAQRSSLFYDMAYRDALDEPLPPEIGEYDDLYGRPDAFAERVLSDIDHEDPRLALLALYASASLGAPHTDRAAQRLIPLIENADSPLHEQAWNNAIAMLQREPGSIPLDTLITAAIEQRVLPESLGRMLTLTEHTDTMPPVLLDAILEAFANREPGTTTLSMQRSWGSSWLKDGRLTPEQIDRVRRELLDENG